ncbi:MAG: hypothetical protein ACI9MC_003372, partial [Kiritimatiellia bacterium]
KRQLKNSPHNAKTRLPRGRRALRSTEDCLYYSFWL